MPALKLILLDGSYTVHRLAPDVGIPKPVFAAPFFAITGSGDELSIVVPAEVEVKSDKSEPGWACLRVAGTLDFALVGILAEISTTLAKAGLSIFAISTFDTDYILVKTENLKAAREALTAAGHKVTKARAAKEPDKSPEKPSNLFQSASALLETQIPLIKKLLVEKVGPTTLATLRSEASLAMAVGGVYEFLPTAVRLVVNRDIFVNFCVRNLDDILPEISAVQPKRKKAK
jgi:hypothetical protein